MTTKVADDLVDDIDHIKSILTSIKDMQIDCALRLTDGPRYEPSRITSLVDNGFSFRVFGRHSMLDKSCNFDEIDYLEVNTTSEIMSNKPGASRWMLLDSEPDEDPEGN